MAKQEAEERARREAEERAKLEVEEKAKREFSLAPALFKFKFCALPCLCGRV